MTEGPDTGSWGRFSKTHEPWAIELPCSVVIPTREGKVEAGEEDMLVVDSDGGLYPCDRETFEDMYQRVDG